MSFSPLGLFLSHGSIRLIDLQILKCSYVVHMQVVPLLKDWIKREFHDLMVAVEHGFLNPELAQTLPLLPLLLSLFRCLAHDVKISKAAQIYRKVLQAKTTIKNITRQSRLTIICLLFVLPVLGIWCFYATPPRESKSNRIFEALCLINSHGASGHKDR